MIMRCYSNRMKIVKIKSWGVPPEFITILNTAAGEELFVEDENENLDREDKKPVEEKPTSKDQEPTEI